MSEDNITSQIEEIEALSAIYGDDWTVESEDNRRFSVLVRDEEQENRLKLNIHMPDGYPSTSPPTYELEATHLRGIDKLELQKKLDEVYLDNIGEPIIHLWIEGIREYLSQLKQADDNQSTEHKDLKEEDVEDWSYHYEPHKKAAASTSADETEKCPEIFHGEKLFDRKSVFQAHIAEVHNVHQTKLVMSELLSDKKIAAATHNITAYRVQLSNGAFAEDCVDDGETQAGNRILHLLHAVKAENVIVIVTRWYGGVHLGSDRFKHINRCARDVLEARNFIKPLKGVTSKKKSSKHKS